MAVDVEEFNNWIGQITREAGQRLQRTTLHGIRPERYVEIPEEVSFLVRWEPDGSGVASQMIRLTVQDLRSGGVDVIVAAVRDLME